MQPHRLHDTKSQKDALMNIFYNRPLFTACMAFLTISTISYFVPETTKYVVLAFGAVVLIVSIFMLLLPRLDRLSKHLLMYSLLCSAAIILASSLSLSYFDGNKNKFENIYGNEHTVDATVLSINYESEFYSIYTVKVNSLNGEAFDHDAKLVCEYNACLRVGESFIVKAFAQEPEDKKDGIFNEKLSMLSDGIFSSYISTDESGIILTDRAEFDLNVTFAEMNYKLSRIITDRVGGEAGNLSSAILLGNKHLISNTTSRDFNRSGVSHILALSGMHMTIIMGAVSFILWKLTDNSRKVGIISSVVAVFYLALTGFSLSATRAVLMLLVFYLGLIITAEPDPLTSLSVAGTVIIFLFPGAILDAGFWMSFGATFGILVFMPPFHKFLLDKLYRAFVGKHRKAIVHTVTYVADLFAASIFAIIPLMIVMCVFIKEMSWFTIISSAVLSIPASALILLSLLLICFYSIPYLSVLLAQLIEIVGDFMIDFCSEVSKTEGAVFSLNYPFITTMAIIMCLALLYCFASKHKFKPISAIPFVVSLLVLLTTVSVYENVNKDNLKATFVNVSSVSNVIVLTSEDQAIICDLSNGSKSSYSKALDEIYDSRATEIKAIMLTGYTYLHASTYYDLFASEIVREIWLPYPENEDEYSKMNKIYEVAQKFGVDAYVYKDGEVLRAFDNTEIYVLQDRIERSSVPVTLMSITTPNDSLIYSSPAFNECSLLDTAKELFACADYIIFGHKGPKVKKEYTVEISRMTDAIVFSNKDLISHFDASTVHGAAYFYAPEKISFYLEE